MAGNLKKIEAIGRQINLEEPNVVPFAPYYFDCIALDDNNTAERRRGIRNDHYLLSSGIVDELRLYGDRISAGMASEIKVAINCGIKIKAMTTETANDYKDLFTYPVNGDVEKPWIMCGPGWRREAMKLKKADLVDMWSGSIKALDIAEPLHGLKEEAFEWANETFGHFRNPVSAINHLKKEADELIEAIEKLKQVVQASKPETGDLVRLINQAGDEYADCFLLILDAASSSGITAAELIRLAKAKLEINKNRKWGKRDENGVVEHIREEA